MPQLPSRCHAVCNVSHNRPDHVVAEVVLNIDDRTYNFVTSIYRRRKTAKSSFQLAATVVAESP
jgi:hypothetical protein